MADIDMTEVAELLRELKLRRDTTRKDASTRLISADAEIGRLKHELHSSREHNKKLTEALQSALNRLSLLQTPTPPRGAGL